MYEVQALDASEELVVVVVFLTDLGIPDGRVDIEKNYMPADSYEQLAKTL